MKSPVLRGLVAAVALLSLYVTVLTLVSGWKFMLTQFASYWYFVMTLAAGFGVQFGLYSYLRMAIAQKQASAPGRVLAVSGTTSTAAMVSCCAHYLVNILPILGAVGVITIIAQYQVRLFWIGLSFNLAGVGYMLYQVRKFKKTL